VSAVPASKTLPAPAPKEVPIKRSHPQGCGCALHDFEPRQCSEIVNGERCEKVCRGARALGSHVAYTHKRGKLRARPSLISSPNGLGYIRTLRNPSKAAGVNLSALPRFAQTVSHAAAARGRNRRERALTRYLLERAQANLDSFVDLRYLRVPGKIAEPIALLARLADVPPWVVFDALLTYGLEMVANELRAHRTVPNPHLPAAPLVANQSSPMNPAAKASIETMKSQLLPTSDSW
jgi:hypothetical protein